MAVACGAGACLAGLRQGAEWTLAGDAGENINLDLKFATIF
jgi:hypothetical protein